MRTIVVLAIIATINSVAFAQRPAALMSYARGVSAASASGTEYHISIHGLRVIHSSGASESLSFLRPAPATNMYESAMLYLSTSSFVVRRGDRIALEYDMSVDATATQRMIDALSDAYFATHDSSVYGYSPRNVSGMASAWLDVESGNAGLDTVARAEGCFFSYDREHLITARSKSVSIDLSRFAGMSIQLRGRVMLDLNGRFSNPRCTIIGGGSGIEVTSATDAIPADPARATSSSPSVK
jgi:hypothetical protein